MDAIIILLFHWRINHHDHQVTSIFIEVQLLLLIISKSWHLHINLIYPLILYDRFDLTLNESVVSTWVTEDVAASSLYIRSRDHFFSNNYYHRHSNYYFASIRNSMSSTMDTIIILLFHWRINHHVGSWSIIHLQITYWSVNHCNYYYWSSPKDNLRQFKPLSNELIKSRWLVINYSSTDLVVVALIPYIRTSSVIIRHTLL